MSSKFKPNTTQTPNVIFDRLMYELPDDEFKVLCAIVRKTYGWHKDTDRISNSQFEKMTGIKKRQIQRAKASLKRRGLIAETPPDKLGGVPEYEFLEPDPVSPMTPPHVSADTPPVSPMTPTKDTTQKTLDKSGDGWSLADKGLKQTKTTKEPKFKKARDFSAIEPVLKVLREYDANIEKAISLNTQRMIENEIEENGMEFVSDAVYGRILTVKGTGKPLALTTFFDPDRAEWRADMANLGKRSRDIAEGLKMASQPISQPVIEYLEGEYIENPWQTLTN